MEQMRVYAKMNFRAIVGEDEWWVELTQDNYMWQALLLGVLNRGF
jgi:hypothetical protein